MNGKVCPTGGYVERLTMLKYTLNYCRNLFGVVITLMH